MKFFSYGKDGGPDSNVSGFWIVEIKPLFSIVLLKFEKGSREAFHNHAFNALSWILKGELEEELIDEESVKLTPSLLPIFTSKNRMHRVKGVANATYALSLRGPWESKWKEFFKREGKTVTLTNGRRVVDET